MVKKVEMQKLEILEDTITPVGGALCGCFCEGGIWCGFACVKAL